MRCTEAGFLRNEMQPLVEGPLLELLAGFLAEGAVWLTRYKARKGKFLCVRSQAREQLGCAANLDHPPF
jgi:hypothetical protein